MAAFDSPKNKDYRGQWLYKTDRIVIYPGLPLVYTGVRPSHVNTYRYRKMSAQKITNYRSQVSLFDFPNIKRSVHGVFLGVFVCFFYKSQ